MKVGVTGASGFIGRHLVSALSDSEHEVFKFVRREPKSDNEIYWKPSKQEIDQEKFETLDAIIHLAGESIAPKDILGFLPLAGGRWSKERKSRIYWSRKWASETFIQAFNLQKITQKFLLLLPVTMYMETMAMKSLQKKHLTTGVNTYN